MKNIEQFKNDEYLGKIIKESRLPDPFVDENYNVFLRVFDSRKKCEGCKGLEECGQLSEGERLSLKYDPVLIEEIEYCNYALAKKNKEDIFRKYVYCDIAKNLAGLDLSNVKYTEDQKQLYLKLAAILNDKRDKGLYVSGDVGVGKTYLCSALANSLVKKGKKVAYVKATDFFNEMRSYVGTYSDIIYRTISSLKNVEYLFIDDLGTEAVSDFVRDDILFRILDHRMENKLITIFISNLNKSDLLKHYQYDRKEKANLMNAKRLMERIDILSEDITLSGENMRRK